MRPDFNANSNEGCHILLTMRPVLGWILGIVLFIVLVFTISMTVRLHRLGSGIQKNPTTIAGAACLYSADLATVFPRLVQDVSEKYVLTPAGKIGVNPNTTTPANAMFLRTKQPN